MSSWFESDEELLGELGRALAEPVGAEDDTIDILMTGYDVVMAETVEAFLVHDSAVDKTVAIRSDLAGARMLTFSLDATEVNVEVSDDGWVVGSISPPGAETAFLEQMAGTVESVVDSLGGFEFRLTSPATFRVRLVGPGGGSIATPWIDGPHPTR